MRRKVAGLRFSRMWRARWLEPQHVTVSWCTLTTSLPFGHCELPMRLAPMLGRDASESEPGKHQQRSLGRLRYCGSALALLASDRGGCLVMFTGHCIATRQLPNCWRLRRKVTLLNAQCVLSDVWPSSLPFNPTFFLFLFQYSIFNFI